MIADLEEALEVEAARAGTLDRRGDRGPAHAAGRTRGAGCRCGMRYAIPCCWSSPLARASAVRGRRAAGQGGRRPHAPRHRRRARRQAAGRPAQSCRSRSTSAHDYDPLGGDGEHARPTRALAVDRDPAPPGPPSLRRRPIAGDKAGRRASTSTPSPASTRSRSRSRRRSPAGRRRSTPRPRGPAPTASTDGWTKVGGGTVDSARADASSSPPTARSYRYYLVWITKLPPAPSQRRDRRDHAVRAEARPRTRGRARSARGARARSRAAGRRAPGRARRRPPQLRVDARRR